MSTTIYSARNIGGFSRYSGFHAILYLCLEYGICVKSRGRLLAIAGSNCRESGSRLSSLFLDSEHFLGSEPMTAAHSSMKGPDWSRDSNSAEPLLLPLPLHLHPFLLILREGGRPAHHSGLGLQRDTTSKNSISQVLPMTISNVLTLYTTNVTVYQSVPTSDKRHYIM